MEFPIEIQMLINDFLRPITRPDWRKGSFMNRYYRSEKGKWGQLNRLNIKEFKEYLDVCSDMDENFKQVANYCERKHLDDMDIVFMREDEYNNRER